MTLGSRRNSPAFDTPLNQTPCRKVCKFEGEADELLIHDERSLAASEAVTAS